MLISLRYANVDVINQYYKVILSLYVTKFGAETLIASPKNEILATPCQFPLLHFPALQFWPCRFFHSRIFSAPLGLCFKPTMPVLHVFVDSLLLHDLCSSIIVFNNSSAVSYTMYKTILRKVWPYLQIVSPFLSLSRYWKIQDKIIYCILKIKIPSSKEYLAQHYTHLFVIRRCWV